MARRISMCARREVLAAVAERYRSAGRTEKGRILDELTATTGWHRKHAVRALSAVAANRPGREQAGEETTGPVDGASEPPRGRRRKYGSVRDALIALWEASLTEAVEMAKRLRRASPKTGERRSLRRISAELAAAGYLNERGQPFNPNSIKLMLER
jgi:hypothetical protein